MDFSFRRLLIALFVTVGTAAPAHAEECAAPLDIGIKPDMTAYADYSDFLVAVMEFKARADALEKHQGACPQLYATEPPPAVTSETLASALQRSRNQAQFDYNIHQTWYDRSTSRTFGLPGMANNVLSSQIIGTSLRILEDGPLDPSTQAIVLTLGSPLGGLEDGAVAVDLVNAQFEQLGLEREQQVRLAFIEAEADLQPSQIIVASIGQLRLTYSEGQLLKVRGRVLGQSCGINCSGF
ncbi:MAG: hypothetical protein CVV10_02625 [Gammaproteobacteria bacterium HGW-Gammaproteobacteria-14]|nr:MAG: hypothetical protein CVV10_02625 [Gammaproteobacteria bacterium HGW-Gammaproteobacteria-14]